MKQQALQDALFEEETTAKPVSAAAFPSALEADFPLGHISLVAEHESWRKEIHRPATHTHKWWAQRLGSVFRAIICSAVTRDADSAQAAYTNGMDLSNVRVFDPFAGSGTTLVEAAKLGATVIGKDINPVATLVQRQALQEWNVVELERAFRAIENACRGEIDRLHRTRKGETVLYYFWVAIANCPECAQSVRLFSTHVFARHAYPRRYPTAHAVCPACLDIKTTTYDFEWERCSNGHHFSREGVVSGARMRCPNGHTSRVVDALANEPPSYEMYAKLVLDANGEKRYEPIADFDHALYQEASDLLETRRDDLILPQGELSEGYNTRQAMRWGYRSWSQFFNARQLYCLGLLAASIRDLEASAAEREALAVLFSGTLEFNNLFCSFKGEGTGAVRHMFSHHILKPERTPLEAHPWGTPASSGSFSTLYKSRLLRAHEYKSVPGDHVIQPDGKVERVRGASQPLRFQIVDKWPASGLEHKQAYITSGNAASTDLPANSVDLIITDPPYVDNVHYSELADFFHVWLREIHPFARYPKALSTTRTDGEVQSTSPDEFRNAIAAVWKECNRVLAPSGLLAFTFHQARLTGWVALFSALAEAGFQVSALQPVKAEMSSSVTKTAAAQPSNLDCVISCRKFGVGEPFVATLEEAEAETVQTLSSLKSADVIFGLADARSIAWGSVLSLLTNPLVKKDAEYLVSEAERMAADAIAKLSLE